MEESGKLADDLKKVAQKKADQEMEKKLDDAKKINLANKDRS